MEGCTEYKSSSSSGVQGNQNGLVYSTSPTYITSPHMTASLSAYCDIDLFTLDEVFLSSMVILFEFGVLRRGS